MHGSDPDTKKKEKPDHQVQLISPELLMDAPIGIYTTTPEGRFLSANRTLARMLGYDTPNELIESITDLSKQAYVNPDDRQNAKTLLETYGEVSDYECQWRRRNGKGLWISLNARAIKDESGNTLYYQGFASNIAKRKHNEEDLRKIEWMLSGDQSVDSVQEISPETNDPPYGDLTNLNTSRLILDAVGKETLRNIVNDYLEMLGTSAAVYEKNGDYALGIFSSSWCRFMDQSSRRLCNTDDDGKALASGKWLCHESCWNISKQCIETGNPVDAECSGGLRLYTVPVRAGGEVIGALSFGYGNPPTDFATLDRLASQYAVSKKALRQNARSYETRPPFIIDLAKRRIRSASYLIGEIVERKQAEAALREKTQLLQSITDNMYDLVALTDMQGNFTYVGRSHEILGYDLDSLIGKNVLDFVHPDDYPDVLSAFGELVAKQDDDRKTEYRYRDADGTYRWFETVGRIIRDENGDPKEMIFSTRDFTDRKLSEDLLRDREAFTWTILDNLPIGLSINTVDDSVDFTYMNDNFPRVYRTTRQALEGADSFWDVIYEDPVYREQIKQRILADCASGNPERMQWDDISFTRNGQTYFICARNIPFPDEKYMISTVWDVTESKQAEHKLRESEEKYRFMTEQMNDVIWTSDLDMRVTYISPSDERILGFTREERIGHTLADMLTHASQEKAMEALSKEYALEETGSTGLSRSVTIELEYRHKDGSTRWLETLAAGIRNDEGRLIGTHGVSRDISERKQTEKARWESEEKSRHLEEQLYHAQKMESMGRLAGGVAHDFNNMLTIINGYAEMMADVLPSSDPMYDSVQEIQDAGKRSAVIVRKLLAFARKQNIAPVPLNLNDSVSGMLKMLQRLIGENIDLLWKPCQDAWLTKMDNAQVDQILVNLVVNAHDAIADIGKITIETETIEFDEQYCADHAGFFPGQFVMLAVSDNGCGMDKHVLDNLFEPFFTTKEIGKGTGLGMPTVYGIVKQNNGFINVYSEPGQGTTIRIYFPRYLSDADIPDRKKEKTPAKGRGETILVLEDETVVLNLTRIMLERLEYKVIMANSPSEAMELAKTHDGNIDLLLTDVVMPEMNGREFADQLNGLFPEIKVLFMSGYTANVIAHHTVLDEGMHFIEKPFSINRLAAKVRAVLE